MNPFFEQDGRLRVFSEDDAWLTGTMPLRA
jgi:hypothetical protein